MTAGPSTSSRIIATSRQTRFNPLVQGDASEVDLNDVDISIGEREILVDARIRLKNGVKYGFVGRNGCGKSTVLQAIADKIIPGIPPTLRIHIVSQVAEGGSEDTSEAGQRTAVQRVLDGHVERTNALKERQVLEKIIDAEPTEAQRLMDRLMLDKANEELEEARKIALLRSGAKGWDARKEEIKAEKQLEEAERRLDKLEIEDDVHKRAADMLSEVQVTLELLDSDDAEAQAIRILRGLGFTEGIMNSAFSDLSGGWQSRCRLATALLVQTDVLLLDEPSNFMDLKSILWLERFLKESTNYSTLVLTSHDQVFLDRLAEQTIVLRNHKFDYFDGTPSLMQSVEAEERLHKEKMVAALDKKRDHMEFSIQQGRKMAKAAGDDSRMRSVKSREKKLNERMGLEVSAKGTRFKLNRDLPGYHNDTRRAAIEVERVEQEMAWKIPSAAEIKGVGGSLVGLEKISVGYGKGKKVVLEDVTLTIHPGSRMSIVGSNGQGKSTLAKVLTSDLKPTKGIMTTHPSLRIGYFTQHIVETFDASEPALKYFMDHFEDLGEKISEQNARGFLGGLGLQGRTASHVPIGMLSGGQKVRLALALLLYKQPQLLVLDEVTTHLDAYSIRALARGLRGWDGQLSSSPMTGESLIAYVLLVNQRAERDRWFSSVVVERKAMDEDPDGEPGSTIMVSKGKAKSIEGMKEYESVVERRLARRKD